MRAIEFAAVAVLHSDGALSVEQDLRRERVGLNMQPLWKASLYVQQPFPCAHTPMAVGRQRRVPDSGLVLLDRPPIVRIELIFKFLENLLNRLAGFSNRGIDSVANRVRELLISQH